MLQNQLFRDYMTCFILMNLFIASLSHVSGLYVTVCIVWHNRYVCFPDNINQYSSLEVYLLMGKLLWYAFH